MSVSDSDSAAQSNPTNFMNILLANDGNLRCPLTWKKAQIVCEAFGGFLAAPRDADEVAALQSILESKVAGTEANLVVWTGINSYASSSEYRMSWGPYGNAETRTFSYPNGGNGSYNGFDIHFHAWDTANSQPTTGTGKRCAEQKNSLWSMRSCTQLKPYVCWGVKTNAPPAVPPPPPQTARTALGSGDACSTISNRCDCCRKADGRTDSWVQAYPNCIPPKSGKHFFKEATDGSGWVEHSSGSGLCEVQAYLEGDGSNANLGIADDCVAVLNDCYAAPFN